MTKTIATNVILVSVNHVEDEEIENLLESHDADTIEEVASGMEESVEKIMARQFREANDIPLLDVSTEVYNDWSGRDEEVDNMLTGGE